MKSGTRGLKLAVDIGGTFTDIAVDLGDRYVTDKVLTTPEGPEHGVMDGIARVLASTELSPADIALVVHGTTLATNAIIERKGAKTALIVTGGFRDSVEMAYEDRFDQYDLRIERPEPLVPRYLRWPVTERIAATGDVLAPLDQASVDRLPALIDEHDIASVAIGLIHAYVNPDHEQRIAERLCAARPDLSISLSSEVCPEIREYERQSTTCANAYVQPLMARYLRRLAARLTEIGIAGPLLMMTSGGGLTGLDTATRFPIRLVESGPAGGAILAGDVAAMCDATRVLSFDMGGTTAKICLLDDFQPQNARVFEVARAYRFKSGSGLPLRIPVIEMVEIGAGGGSIAQVDNLSRVTVGPESAGAAPGPACYDRGGVDATVTDADVTLGRIVPSHFAGGTMSLAPDLAQRALVRGVGDALNLDGPHAAYAVGEIVDEAMANAARVHAVERGKDVTGRTLIAFGGAAPLHAARLAEKLGIDEIIVPADAGVGSAIGLLRAPIAYEVVRSRYMLLSQFDHAAANDTLEKMRAEAARVVASAAPDQPVAETRGAYMRYVGQGHEIAVPLPRQALVEGDGDAVGHAFRDAYENQYGRAIPGVDVEILSWTLQLGTTPMRPDRVPEPAASVPPPAGEYQSVFDADKGAFTEIAVLQRDDLPPGAIVDGPALIVERQTTTVVAANLRASVDGHRHIVLTRKPD